MQWSAEYLGYHVNNDEQLVLEIGILVARILLFRFESLYLDSLLILISTTFCSFSWLPIYSVDKNLSNSCFHCKKEWSALKPHGIHCISLSVQTLADYLESKVCATSHQSLYSLAVICCNFWRKKGHSPGTHLCCVWCIFEIKRSVLAFILLVSKQCRIHWPVIDLERKPFIVFTIFTNNLI